MIDLGTCIANQNTENTPKKVEVSVKTDDVQRNVSYDDLTTFEKKLVDMYNRSENPNEQRNHLSNLAQSVLSELIAEQKYTDISVEAKSGEQRAFAEVNGNYL